MYTILDRQELLEHAESQAVSIHFVNTRAFSQSLPSNTFSLSENIFYDPHHGTDNDKSVSYLDDNGQFRWHFGLDDYWESSFSVDWADALYYTFCKPENGMHQC